MIDWPVGMESLENINYVNNELQFALNRQYI